MIQIVIFSYNRAIQLDTLLTSIRQRWISPVYSVDILFNTSNDSFQNGYKKIISKYSQDSRFNFHKETLVKGPYYGIKELLNVYNIKRLIDTPSLRSPKSNFRNNLLDIISLNTSKFVMFMTDDAMFIDNVELPEDIFVWLNSNPQKNQFVLRFGKDTNDRPSSVKIDNEYLEWNYSDYKFDTDWGYNFSVDAHIYSKELVRKYFKKFIFNNPNTLEGFIAARMRSNGDANNARCVLYPKLLSFPVNMVQNVVNNESCNVSPEYLNRKYLDGYTLRYPIPTQIDCFQVYPEYLIFEKGDMVEHMSIGKAKRNEI